MSAYREFRFGWSVTQVMASLAVFTLLAPLFLGPYRDEELSSMACAEAAPRAPAPPQPEAI